MQEEHISVLSELEKDSSKRTHSTTRKSKKETEESCFTKNIPSYISCVITTLSNFSISLIFTFHCMYYYQLQTALSLVFILSITCVTFVGTFKAHV